MTDRSPDEERLRAALHDAAAGVRPSDRLGEIRRRTRTSARGSGRARRWLPVASGAAIATAVVVVGTVAVTQRNGQEPTQPGPATTATQSAEAGDRATPVYFLGRTAIGPRLYREFQRLADAPPAERVAIALDRLTVSAGADDPDYETFWPDSSFLDVAVGDEAVTVDVASQALASPPGTSERDRWLALQQVVFTAEAVVGDDLPVAFEHAGAPASEVLGVPVSGPVARDRQYDVVAPVNISDPVEGLTVDAGAGWSANGTASDYVTEVDWAVTDDGVVVDRGTVPVTTDAPGSAAFPGWTIPGLGADLSPGEYVLETRVTGVGETSDSPATFDDTRTVLVR